MIETEQIGDIFDDAVVDSNVPVTEMSLRFFHQNSCLSGYIDVGDGCCRRNALMTSLRCDIMISPPI